MKTGPLDNMKKRPVQKAIRSRNVVIVLADSGLNIANGIVHLEDHQFMERSKRKSAKKKEERKGKSELSDMRKRKSREITELMRPNN
jgi:hypothetical protein